LDGRGQARHAKKTAADRIAREALRLRRIAERENLGFLAYLLAMAHIEALETAERNTDDPNPV
jgi:hypothetical protein